MIYDDSGKVRETLQKISDGVMHARRDDVKWGDAWVSVMSGIDAFSVDRACIAVLKGGEASKSEIDEAKLCLHLVRGGRAFAKRIREVWADSCYSHPEREKIPDLWVKLYGYHRGQFPALEARSNA